MNKAFVKDDDTWQDPELERDPRADIPPGSRNYMTPAGAAGLRAELDALLNRERPRLLADLNRLDRGSMGQASQAYRDSRKALSRLEVRIKFITGRLEITEVVDPARQSGEIVRFGARVTVQPETGAQATYHIVGIDEADAARNQIAWTSPLARALLDRESGEVTKAHVPGGEIKLEIIDISYGKNDTARSPL